MARLQLQLVSPQRLLLNGEYDSLTCPTPQGQITILPGHAPLVSTLESGEVITRNGSDVQNLHVSGGFVEVQGGNKIVLLADTAEHHYEIDVQEAEVARAQAKTTIQQGNLLAEEYVATVASLQRNLSRIRIARKHAHRRTTPITSEGLLKD